MAQIPYWNWGYFPLLSLKKVLANWLYGEKMLETNHLELQENDRELITRPKLKRLILEYLQKRSRKEILLEEPRDEESDSLE